MVLFHLIKTNALVVLYSLKARKYNIFYFIIVKMYQLCFLLYFDLTKI